ncbi:hypothetical protein [Enterococcus ureasiticus]|uniref:Uncharacterized protein n=1 Tax=Enterococcus ureasiticus TaxID=903984 RepID=A0A1E5GAC1_9ENTE|nr:hypothetical protein [Enterococcus ureasiticus]OEG09545.1 hypothetical protein BCR21_14440 [Enterococcus ureasiticus]
MNTGEVLLTSDTSTSTVNNSEGSYTSAITVDFNGTKTSTNRAVTVFGADLRAPFYLTIEKNKKFALGTNYATVFSKYQTTYLLSQRV